MRRFFLIIHKVYHLRVGLDASLYGKRYRTQAGGVAPAGVMLTLVEPKPFAETVTSALRTVVSVLGLAVTVIVWLPLPDAGLTLSHDVASDGTAALHAIFAVTVKVLLSPAAAKLSASAPMLNWSGATGLPSSSEQLRTSRNTGFLNPNRRNLFIFFLKCKL